MEDEERPGLLLITKKEIIFLRRKLSAYDPADKYVSLFPRYVFPTFRFLRYKY